jgi:hypothetical protein
MTIMRRRLTVTPSASDAGGSAVQNPMLSVRALALNEQAVKFSETSHLAPGALRRGSFPLPRGAPGELGFRVVGFSESREAP